MFRDKAFNIAFLISLSWHIFCMLCFTIVILPISFPTSKLSNVSFLGPILEKTAFEMMLEKRPASKRTLYSESMPLNNIFLSPEEKTLLGELKVGDFFLIEKKDEVKVSANDLFGDFKVTPPLYTYDEDFFIEDSLANREILFKPEMPLVARRIESRQESFIVELKFKVSSNGRVEEAVLLASSGYPDVDLAAINYIKAFQFSPLNKEDGPVWDKVKLNLKSKPR